MNNVRSNRFKLSPRGVMVAMVSAALSPAALANTGHVDFAIGSIVVTGANGQVHTLFKGAEVGTGDKITSGADGRAQIRFSDGAYMSIQPNTEFDIKQYRFNGKDDGTESALFGLFKGALRTVTGLVGRVNKSKFQITTPTATIGIRGTGGLIQVGGDGSTLVIGSSGIWSLTNNGGSLDIPAGTAGFAGTNRNAPPQPTTTGPVIPPPQPTTAVPPTIVQGDVVNSAGAPVSLFGTVLTSGPGYAVSDAGIGSPSSSLNSNAVFDSAGLLTQFSSGSNVFTFSGTQGTDSGDDGVMAWGRWIGTVLQNGSSVGTFTANEGLHWVVGQPATNMPTGTTFSYTFVGATSPTFTPGSSQANTTPGTFSGMLTGDFINNRVGLSMTVTMPATGAYNVSTPGFTSGGQNPSGLPITGTGFSGSFTNFGVTTCTGGCTTTVSGGFAGAGANHAGFTYQIVDSIASNTVVGAAVFKH